MDRHAVIRTPKGLPVTPLARRLAVERGIDVADVEAAVLARRGRRVRVADIAGLRRPAVRPAQAPAAPALVPAQAPGGGKGGFAPQVAQCVEADFSAAEAARLAAGPVADADEARLAILARAACLALNDYPLVNASVGASGLVVHGRIDLALSLSGPGLSRLALVEDAAGLTAAEILKVLRQGTGQGQGRATYAIAMDCWPGRVMTAPELPAHRAAMIAADGLRPRPAVRQAGGGDVVTLRPLMALVQRFDHRAFDGAYSASFLSSLCGRIETHDWGAELNNTGI